MSSRIRTCKNHMGFVYIGLTILFTVYGQLVIKWQVSQAGAFPVETQEKLLFLMRLVLHPVVISGFVAAFLASLSWMAAMTQFDLSFAYPFTSLSFILVLISSALFFEEPISLYKVLGTFLIVMGLYVATR